MFRLSLLLMSLCLIPALEAWSRPAAELKPGLWRIQVRTPTNGVVPPPPQNAEECLCGEQFADLGNYFAPKLEGMNATCNNTREPTTDPSIMNHRMHCEGGGLTVDAMSKVTIVSPTQFFISLEINSQTEAETGHATAESEGSWAGAC